MYSVLPRPYGTPGLQGPEGLVYDSQLLFNWNNVFWGANLLLAQVTVRAGRRTARCHTPHSLQPCYTPQTSAPAGMLASCRRSGPPSWATVAAAAAECLSNGQA